MPMYGLLPSIITEIDLISGGQSSVMGLRLLGKSLGIIRSFLGLAFDFAITRHPLR